MTPRTARKIGLPTVGLLLTLSTVACEKVPLLAPTGSTITLTALASALSIQGTADIIAQVLEAAGTPPHSGTVVTFTTTLGSIEPSEARTDVTGRVTVKFRAGTVNGVATIIATSGGATTGTTGALKIAIGAAAVARINITASPGTVPAAGGPTTITANVADINGNVLPSVPVTFTTTAGTLSVAVANADQNGNATTVLTTNRAADVTATAGASTTGTGSSTTTAPITAKVTVAVNTILGITVGAGVPASPTVGQTVTFPITQASGTPGSPIQRTVVEWGDGGSNVYTGLPFSISHVFGASGSYGIRVTATDAFGDTAVGGNVIVVAPRPVLNVAVTATPTNVSVAAGGIISFGIVITPAGSAITNLFIDFGDGSSVSLAGSPSPVPHKYTAPSGIDGYKVTVTATENTGTTGAGSTIVIVNP